MIVCVCNNISDKTIRAAADNGVRNLAELRSELGVGTCCGKCHSCAKTVLREHLEDRALETATNFTPLSRALPLAA